MHGPRDPKLMAKALRAAMADRDVMLSHSDCLEIVARQLGFADWNTAAAAPGALKLPLGWVVGGSHSQDYDLGVDPSKPGSPATIRALHQRGSQTGFATLMQSISAEAYRGQRLRLSAELCAQDVTGAVTLWMRVDDAQKVQIAFDNMEMRHKDGPLTGTVHWTPRTIVLDVPDTGHVLNYGFYLRGWGQAWARSFALDPVSRDVPVTDSASVQMKAPHNLNFAQVIT